MATSSKLFCVIPALLAVMTGAASAQDAELVSASISDAISTELPVEAVFTPSEDDTEVGLVGCADAYDIITGVEECCDSGMCGDVCCEEVCCDDGCSSDGCCDTGIISSGCDKSLSSVACCGPWWAHRNGGYGELLFLSPGNSDLIYAVEQTDPSANASPTGPLGLSNIEEELGYKVGFSYALSDCSSLVASYSRWDGDTFSSINAAAGNVLNSQVIHPSTATTGAASLSADAYQLVNFQLADIMLRRVYRATDCSVINWNAGLRYGNLEQGLSANQTVATATGLTNVTTDIDFNGFGIVSGLDAERRAQCSGLFMYGKAFGSLLAGNWQADYTQTNQFGGGVVGNRYDDYRISPVVETELGVGWTSQGGGLRLSSGYMFSTWFNAVNNRDYIAAFRAGNLLELDHSVTFSGLTFRTELRF